MRRQKGISQSGEKNFFACFGCQDVEETFSEPIRHWCELTP